MVSMFSNSSDTMDTHSVLSDLDRSLRSSSIGDQCEGIVKVPWLFERYPFPILINAASLKLSEIYQTGNNFLRILILQVVKESEKHLDKILNIDEFVRHLFAVSYSNDPLARSITLQTLGHIARIVSNNKNIHHLIRNSLESNDELEVHAAIEASVSFAIQSKEFAQNIYPKIIYMIEGLATPMNIKIRLLEVINNLHHNFAIVEDARKKLISFLGKYPEKKFVCENLHTLTSIASSSITHIPDQVELLLEYYTKDPRIHVKLSVLDDLRNLAKESAHLWGKESITKFVDLVFLNFDHNNLHFTLNSMEVKELRILCKSLAVLSELFGSPSIFIDNSLFSLENISKIVNFSTQIIYQSTFHASCTENLQMSLISKCFIILTNICLYMNPQSSENFNVLQETCSAYETYFLSKFTKEIEKESQPALKQIFRSLVTFCQTRESDSGKIRSVTEALRFIFLQSKPNSLWYEMICETICALACVIRQNQSLTADDILDLITGKKSKIGLPKNERVAIKFLEIYFQLKNCNIISKKETDVLLNQLSKHNIWTCYKILRSAMRYGHHNFAAQLLAKIKPSTESIEVSYFWMNSLIKITEAESCLMIEDMNQMRSEDFLTANYNNEKFEHRLMTSISIYTQGLSHLKASVSNTKPMRFQCEYIKLRLKYLQAHKHFRQCCQMLQSSPIPASSVANNSPVVSDEFFRCGRIVTSIQKCSREFRSISEGYSILYQSSFDADPNTLRNIQLLQHSCTILAEVIENLFQKNHRINSLFVPARNSSNDGTESDAGIVHDLRNQPEDQRKQSRYTIIEHKELEDVCAIISELMRSDQLMSLTAIESKQMANDGKRFLSLFTKQIDMLLRISTRILLVPLPFPRFFFQPIQSTNIKLELSSQQRNSQDTININQSVQFVLYVEGIVMTNHSKPKLSVAKVPASLVSDYNAMMKTLNRPPTMKKNTTDSGQKIFRKVNKILLVLNTVPIACNNEMANIQPQSTITMHSIVVPLNDYFRTQFLLSFNTCGLYNITVETSIIDENEAQWKSGPIQSITAKVIEDFKNI